MQQTIRIIVTGKVQGVFYRQRTKEMAEQLGINGTVKNLPDGSVEVIASGEAAALEQLSGWCKNGPPKAIVQNVVITTMPYCSFSGFTIVRW